MIKSVITVEEDMQQLEAEQELELRSIVEDLELFFEPIHDELEPLLHPKKEEGEGEEQPDVGKDKKKDDKKKEVKKGGGKDELAAYESNLPLPSSGIENLILLLDTRLSDLPFEALELFEGIPVISRDFNLHLYTTRLMKLGHKAEIHNNNGINKEELKFIYDPPEPM